MNTIQIGSKYEKKVEQEYIEQGYKTHRMRKSRFGKNDLLGIADIVATKNDSFVFVACAVGRAQSATVAKIEALRPWIPPFVKIYYHIQKKNGEEEVRTY